MSAKAITRSTGPPCLHGFSLSVMPAQIRRRVDQIHAQRQHELFFYSALPNHNSAAHARVDIKAYRRYLQITGGAAEFASIPAQIPNLFGLNYLNEAPDELALGFK